MEDDNKAIQPLASEMYEDLKKSNSFKEKLIWFLVAALLITNLYHIYQWSQFDTVVVDSGDGAGNANYVHGDNTGGIFNGEGSSSSAQEWEIEGDESQT